MTNGRVALVGAGPWAKGLLTLRGAELIGQADVVLYDYLVNEDHLQHASSKCVCKSVGRPPNRMSQDEINQFLLTAAQSGKHVVRLKGGDPFIFGRGGEEAAFLKGYQIPIEVVPGITTALAAAAYSGVPLTHRDVSSTLTLITGHEKESGDISRLNWKLLSQLDTLVFYMAAGTIKNIASNLIKHGMSKNTPIAFVRWVTRSTQATAVSTLEEVSKSAGPRPTPPVLIVIGKVVDTSEKLDWFESRRLHGKRILITRSKHQQSSLHRPLEELGAEAVGIPLIELEPIEDERHETMYSNLGSYDWVVFTSANAVDVFFRGLEARGLDARALGNLRVATVGPVTARRLKQYGICSDLTPDTYLSEGLVEAFAKQKIEGVQFLLPRAEVARATLPDALSQQGASVEIVPTYRTSTTQPNPALRQKMNLNSLNAVTFTSSSTVRALEKWITEDEQATFKATVPAFCIGPATRKTAQEYGYAHIVMAEVFTVQGLVDALEGYLPGYEKESSS